MAKITGRIEVLVNGNLLLNKAGATANGVGVSGQPNYELEQISGDTGPHGFIEKPIPATCVVTITDRDDISLSDLASVMENGTVIFRAAGGGKVYTMEGATCLRNFTITGGEGETEITFLGPFWVETVSAS
ncbi:phage tail tube protein [Patescibacteria group bacterium]|nr:phage tail tube protein [Patescibacteria group bacterium]